MPVETAVTRSMSSMALAQEILALGKAVDPYLVEGCLTNFRNFQSDGADPSSERYIPLLVETRRGAYDLIAQLQRHSRSLWKDVRIPSVYRRYLSPDGTKPADHPSHYLTCLVLQSSLVEFLRLDCVIRAQMGLPRKGGVDQQLMTDESDKDALLGTFGAVESGPDSRFSEEEYDPQRPALPGNLQDRPVIGVIDDGFPFLHPAVYPRFARIWQQDPSDRHIPKFLGYGRVIVRKTPSGSGAARQLATPFDRARRATVPGHGTSVTHLLAGTTVVLPQDRPSALPLADVASGCDLIAVQLPKRLLGDTAGGALCVHALDAVRYIVDRAETYAPESVTGGANIERVARPVVINMSYGTLSGPHDGTSPLDGALAEMVARRPGLGIVVAAGNSQRIPCHAAMDVAGGGGAGEMGLFVAPDNPLVTSVEVWMPGLADTSSISVKLTDPRGNHVSVSWPGFADLATGARVIFPTQTAMGGRGRMALVIIDPTRMHHACHPAASGTWTIMVTNGSKDALRVEAWVERSDIADKAIRRQQAYFVGPAVTYARDRRTMASPATAPGVYRVGALRIADGKRAAYSSCDTVIGLPQSFHYGDFGPVLAGIRTPGDHEGTSRRISGTSAAAPLFARHLVNNWSFVGPAPTLRPEPTTSPEVP